MRLVYYASAHLLIVLVMIVIGLPIVHLNVSEVSMSNSLFLRLEGLVLLAISGLIFGIRHIKRVSNL